MALWLDAQCLSVLTHPGLVGLVRSTKASNEKKWQTWNVINSSVSEFWLLQDSTQWDQLPTTDDSILKLEKYIWRSSSAFSAWHQAVERSLCYFSSSGQVYMQGSSSPIAFNSSDTGQRWLILETTTDQDISSIWHWAWSCCGRYYLVSTGTMNFILLYTVSWSY